jgi:hypothetical protein
MAASLRVVPFGAGVVAGAFGGADVVIGCARISMMARSTNAPCKGRIQMRKTNPLHLFTSGLQRTAKSGLAIGKSEERTSSVRLVRPEKCQ